MNAKRTVPRSISSSCFAVAAVALCASAGCGRPIQSGDDLSASDDLAGFALDFATTTPPDEPAPANPDLGGLDFATPPDLAPPPDLTPPRDLAMPASCSDHARDDGETDVDCGGGVCSPCADGRMCAVASDCVDLVCTGGVCQAPTCQDGVENGMETGVDCGGPCPLCPTALLLAGGTSGIFAGEYTGGAWATTALAGYSVEVPAVTVAPDGYGIGLIRYTKMGDPLDQSLEYTKWSPYAWTQLAPLGNAITTRDAPALVSSEVAGKSLVQAVFHGLDYNFYYAAWSGAAWAPTAEASQIAGNSAPALAANGGDATLAYTRAFSNDAASADRTGGVWQAAIGFANDPNIAIAPTLVAVGGAGNPDQLLVYVRVDGQVIWLTRTAGTWSSTNPVPNALTGDRVALASLPGGGAVLAFRGNDQLLYYSQFASGAWSQAAAVVTPNVSLAGAPSIARGIGVATAELAFVQMDGVAYHSRLIKGAWSAPAAVGGSNLSNVAIATGP